MFQIVSQLKRRMSVRRGVSCCSVIKLPAQLNIDHDEDRIDMIHQWIETLCDPYSNLVLELNTNAQVAKHYKSLFTF